MKTLVRIAVVLLMISGISAATKPLAPGTYSVQPCPAPIVCPAEKVCPVCVECPAQATVLPRLDVYANDTVAIPIDTDVLPCGSGAAHADFFDPTDHPSHVLQWKEEKKGLKEWQKWTIGIVGGVVLGMIIEHQFDDDHGGDTNKKIIIVRPPTVDCPDNGHGPDCD